jgi:prepilin-type N-terminal cleavage/methylation domain-containing protein
MRRERGFTLIELLIAVSVGSVVMLATFSILDSSVVLTGKTQKRVDATQRGRLAMENITARLRSQVCLDRTTPAIVGTGLSAPASDQYRVNFWMFNRIGTFAPQRHVIAWDTNTNSITDTAFNQAGTQVSSRTLLSKVRPPNPANTPVFRYYAYPATGGTTPSRGPLTTPLSPADAAAVALIKIDFTVQPDVGSAAVVTSGTLPEGSQTFSDQVFSRTADPNDPTGPKGPVCA